MWGTMSWNGRTRNLRFTIDDLGLRVEPGCLGVTGTKPLRLGAGISEEELAERDDDEGGAQGQNPGDAGKCAGLGFAGLHLAHVATCQDKPLRVGYDHRGDADAGPRL